MNELINICLHRILKNAADPYALPERKALALLRLLGLLRCHVNISFDDGYYDSLLFVRKYSSRFPQFGWYFFFSPALAVEGGQYPWDASPQRMATHQELLELARDTTVVLGNHTNRHLRQFGLSDSEWQTEYAQSIAIYETHFGECLHLAFPYGTPGVDFDSRVVNFLHARHPNLQLWSTEARMQRSLNLPVRPRIVVRNINWASIIARLAYYALCKSPV